MIVGNKFLLNVLLHWIPDGEHSRVLEFDLMVMNDPQRTIAIFTYIEIVLNNIYIFLKKIVRYKEYKNIYF